MKKLLTRAQYDKWMAKLPKNMCTFCEWKEHQMVLKEFEHWVWIANLAPYWYWHTMIMSKRHFVEFDEMSFKEAGELPEVLAYTKKKFIDAKLKRSDGKKVEKFVYFWRLRLNRYDPISKTIRPDHFHVHLAPDKDHLWDSTLDKDAYKVDMNKLKGGDL